MTSERASRPWLQIVSASLVVALSTPAMAAPPSDDIAEQAESPSAAPPASASSEAEQTTPPDARPDPELAPEPSPDPSSEHDPGPTSATSEGPARASDEAEPRPIDPSNAGKSAPELFREGQDAYDIGDYATATAKFEAAWDASAEPALLFNLGQAYWQWHAVDPELRHLRRARKLFENYDKIMREGDEGYDPAEVESILAAIDAQLVAAEQAEILRAQLLADRAPAPEAFDYAALRAERRRRATKALTVSGSLLITIGALALATGAGGLVARGAMGFSLDQSGGGEAGQNNPNSAEDDARMRSTYLLGGQIAFGGLIGGAALLPIGITLRVIGGSRAKKDHRAHEAVALAPGGTLLTVHF